MRKIFLFFFVSVAFTFAELMQDFLLIFSIEKKKLSCSTVELRHKDSQSGGIVMLLKGLGHEIYFIFLLKWILLGQLRASTGF
jgi:hypothetical protein